MKLFFTLLSEILRSLASSFKAASRSATPSDFTTGLSSNPIHRELFPVGYDYNTDEHIYASGRREPARIRWPYGKKNEADDSL